MKKGKEVEGEEIGGRRGRRWEEEKEVGVERGGRRGRR